MLKNVKFCCLAKTPETPVPKQIENNASKAGERVFTDVAGPITPSSTDGFRYFVTFIDEYSSHASVKFMRHKNKLYKSSRNTLMKMVLLAYYSLTMEPSIRTKVSNSFVPITISSEKTLFLKLLKRMVLQIDTAEQWLKLLKVF